MTARATRRTLSHVGGLPTFRVSGDLTEALGTRYVPGWLAPQAWPTGPPPALPSIRAISADIVSILRQGRGLAVVGIETAGTDDELCSMAWNLFTTVCHPVPQYRTGELICRVEVTGTASGADHYSSSDQSGAFHTDGTLLERPPDVVALLCLSSADVGGETVLLDGAELCRRLDAVDPEHLRTLAQRHHLDTMGQIPGVETRKRAIVSRRGDRISLCYLRRYVEQGHLKAGVVVPAELRRAMDLLDRSASDESHQIPILLRRGEVLLWDNHRFLHGRRAFEEMRSRRRLRRMYGMHHDAPP